MRRFAAEFIGSALLLATVIGSGIMGEALAGGNIAIALLANAIATGAILYVLIVALGPISGAHFNPVVTLVMLLRRAIGPRESAGYVAAQVGGAILGVWVAHVMFGEAVFQLSSRVRSGGAQWFSEIVAAFGWVMCPFLLQRKLAVR
jgi:glycerol uptake facilitator-like aquaporin